MRIEFKITEVFCRTPTVEPTPERTTEDGPRDIVQRRPILREGIFKNALASVHHVKSILFLIRLKNGHTFQI